MKLLTSLSLLFCTATASPIFSVRRDSNATAETFYLKTSGASNPEHNDLYVYGYHTGAGLNDAVLTSDINTASKGFFNDTQVQFDLGTPFPWGLQMGPSNNYGSWEPVWINVGYGSGDFYRNGTELQWSKQKGFGGWLVCDWYHNAPQLFYIYRYYTPDIPETCSRVTLKTESSA